MLIRTRSFFLSALVSAACLTAVGCAEDPTADDPAEEIDPAAVRQTRPIDPVHADPTSLRPIRPWDATRPVRPMPLPVDPPRDPLTVSAPTLAPTIIVDELEGLRRRAVPLPRPAIDGATDAPVIDPGNDDDDLVDSRGISGDMAVDTGVL